MSFNPAQPAVWYGGVFQGSAFAAGMAFSDLRRVLESYQSDQKCLIDLSIPRIMLPYENGVIFVEGIHSSMGRDEESFLVEVSGSANNGDLPVDSFERLLKELSGVCTLAGLSGGPVRVRDKT